MDATPIVNEPSYAKAAQSPHAWNAAVAAEQLARETMERFHSEVVAPIGKAHDDGKAKVSEAMGAEEAWGTFTQAHAVAAEHMIRTPAPTLADVVRKIELGLESGRFGAYLPRDDEYQCIAALADDVRRFASNSHSAHTETCKGTTVRARSDWNALDDLCPKIGRVVSLVAALGLGWDEFASVVKLDSDDARRMFGVEDALLDTVIQEVTLLDRRATDLHNEACKRDAA